MMDVVIPLKRITQAKSRLSGTLGTEHRATLVVAMAGDLVEMLVKHPAVGQIHAVVGEGWERAQLGKLGVRVVPEQSLDAVGLNAVCGRAVTGLATPHVLLLHGDLPLLTASNVNDVACELARNDLVLCPDLRRRGTNAMAFATGEPPELNFGANSYARHSESAEIQGRNWTTLLRPGLSFDLDTDQDFEMLNRACLEGRVPGVRTAEWFEQYTRNKHEAHYAAGERVSQ